MPLTPEQLQRVSERQHVAAHDGGGRTRLVAGPGTGKSTSVEERARWLVQDRDVHATQVFVVSFTRASARDLRDRIVTYCRNKGIEHASLISVSTLHSLALKVLRAAGQLEQYPTDPMVLDDWELKHIFEAEFSVDSGILPSRCKEVRRDHEAFWSTGQWEPPNYIPPDPPITGNERARFLAFHGPRTQVYACVLPGEVVRKCVDGIRAGTLDPAALLRAEELIVDEFQDLNPCDIEFVEHFVRAEIATFVAGDDDQSLYSFRFASPSGIQQFVAKHAGAGDHLLEECLRCTPAIVEAASALIAVNSPPGRIPKNLTSLYGQANPPIHGRVFRHHFPSATAEARAIAQSCSQLLSQGLNPRDMLILLSNSNLTERTITNALSDAEVPFEPIKRSEFRDSDAGRLLLAVLRTVLDRQDYIAYRTILGLLDGVGIGTCNSTANKVTIHNLNFRALFSDVLSANVFNSREVTALTRAREIISAVIPWGVGDDFASHRHALDDIVTTALGAGKLGDWPDVADSLPAGITIQELRDYLWAANDEQQAAILEACYERLGMEIPDQGLLPAKVRIMTMHGAKGLSAKVVFIPALEEEVIPGEWRRAYPGLVLEAARMLYVSITRARAACFLSYSTRRTIFGRSTVTRASRFCNNLAGQFSYTNDGISQADAAAIAADCIVL
jgi:DNA helicase II / ATP-dependent DNA helicase PcrA